MLMFLAPWEIKIIDVGSAHFIMTLLTRMLLRLMMMKVENMLIEMQMIDMMDQRKKS